MAKSDPNAVYAFEVGVKGTDWKETVHARTAGAAKYSYWLDVKDAWQDVPITAMTCRKIGSPRTSSEFHRVAETRGVTFKCGDRVKAGGRGGVVTGYNDSCNFEVILDGFRHPLPFHPCDIVMEPNQ